MLYFPCESVFTGTASDEEEVALGGACEGLFFSLGEVCFFVFAHVARSVASKGIKASRQRGADIYGESLSLSIFVKPVEDFIGVVCGFYFVKAVDDFALGVDDVGGSGDSHVFSAIH